MRSNAFVSVTALLITLNAIWMGFVADREVRMAISSYDTSSLESRAQDPVTVIVDILFIVAFIAELVMRMVGFRSVFWIGPDWRWNFFDLAVVLSGIVDTSWQGSGLDTRFGQVTPCAQDDQDSASGPHRAVVQEVARDASGHFHFRRVPLVGNIAPDFCYVPFCRCVYPGQCTRLGKRDIPRQSTCGDLQAIFLELALWPC